MIRGLTTLSSGVRAIRRGPPLPSSSWSSSSRSLVRVSSRAFSSVSSGGEANDAAAEANDDDDGEDDETTGVGGATTAGLSSVLRRLQRVDVASLCDADKSLREQGVSDYGGLSLMDSSLRLMTDDYYHATSSVAPRRRPTTNVGRGRADHRRRPPPRYFSLDDDDDHHDHHEDDHSHHYDHHDDYDHCSDHACRLVGIARTVRLDRPNDFLGVLQGLEASRPGEVLVVDAARSTRAVAGSLFLTEARRRGLAGVVVDGPVRDLREMRAVGLPCFAVGATPYSGAVDAPSSSASSDATVVCAGATVRPGDVCVGDRDGVVVASPEDAARLIDLVERIQRVEGEVLRSMRANDRSLYDMINFKEHLERRRRGLPSALEFTL